MFPPYPRLRRRPMARIKAPVVITANDLLTGEVVYLNQAHR